MRNVLQEIGVNVKWMTDANPDGSSQGSGPEKADNILNLYVPVKSA